MTDRERHAYEQKMDARLMKWDAQMQILRARAKEASADTKAAIAQELDELEERADATRKKVGDLRDASGEAWQDVKAGLENSWHALESAVEAAKSRFN